MNILTFDIEEWFHLLDNPSTKTEQDWCQYECRLHRNVDRIFQLLEETNSRATFFCLGWVARKYPDVIRRIDAAGYEVATHSDLHQLVYEQSPHECRTDLDRSIKSLQDVTGKKVSYYRAPGFSVKEQNRWIFPLLMELGIEIDCSMFPARRAHGGDSSFGIAKPCYIDVDGAMLKEFPINTVNLLGQDLIFSGGGYFRLLPYAVIQNFMRQSPYVMTYFHPRDFDPQQPMVPGLSRLRQFKSYYGLSGCWEKLRHLLTDYRFVDLQEADRQVKWSESRVQRFQVNS
ncbi:polysaccharide deacetylase family protein [Larkinella rosea]|uniref:DUF3473 domain-containing protein n=1 Tax=Larkinella rosea TaxID=2025312 RepID=A0A3P1BZM5_9BACT|nr:polysaccharide deacetylase family protein [Larkinella rosea]RRB06605.1 DUF3473 domain-containing protein [Larkinella rosea]